MNIIIELENPEGLPPSRRRDIVRKLAQFLNTIPGTTVGAYTDRTALSMQKETAGGPKFKSIGTGDWVLYGAIAAHSLHTVIKILLEWIKASGSQKIKIKTKKDSFEFPANTSPQKLRELIEAVTKTYHVNPKAHSKGQGPRSDKATERTKKAR